MVGRAEFAYLIAEMARSKGIMNKEVFSIVIWALLWATIVAPFAFRKVLNTYAAQNSETRRDIVKGESSACDVIKIDEGKMAQHITLIDGHKWLGGSMGACRVQIMFQNSPGNACEIKMLSSLWTDFKTLGMMVTRVVENADLDARHMVFRIENKDGTKLEDSHLEFIQETLFNTLVNTGAHIVLFPQLCTGDRDTTLARMTVSMCFEDFKECPPKLEQILLGVTELGFAVKRMSAELHHHICLMHFLVVDTGLKSNEGMDVNRIGSENSGKQGGVNMLREGVRQLLKKLDTRKRNESYMVVEALTHEVGDFGESIHTIDTLMMPQPAELRTYKLAVQRSYESHLAVKDFRFDEPEVKQGNSDLLSPVTEWLETKKTYTCVSASR